MRVNHQNSVRMTHPYSYRNVVPTTVLTRSRLVSLNAARPVPTVVPQTTMKSLRPVKHVVNKGVKGNANKASANWIQVSHDLGPQKTLGFLLDVQGNPHQALKDKGVINSGFSRHMTRNIYFLLDFKETNKGYVAFGGNPKGGKITGKDPLGKFDEKADEGFLVGYYVNSKVWKETVSAQQYVLLPLWSTGSQDPQNTNADVATDAAFDVKENENDVHVSPSSSDKPKKHDAKAKRGDRGKSLIELSTKVRDLRVEFEDFSINITNRVNAVSAPVTAAGPDPTNIINSFNTASPSDIAVNMPALEDIVYSDEEEDVGAEADFSNLETNISVSPIPTTRIHKYHHDTQIIGDLTLTPQIRNLPKGKRAIDSKWVFRNKKDEIGIVIRNKARLAAQGHTEEEGIDYDEVFAPVARIEAIRLFLAYASFMGFMPDKVYKVVKALYGLHQAPTDWYETLANYLLENGFQRGKIDHTLFIKKQKEDILLVQVYVDDIIFGSTNKEMCKAFESLMKDKFQLSSMGELSFFLGLQVKQKDDGIFISQDKYIAEILKKFVFTDVKSASTPIETEKPLLKDLDGEDVDVHIYRSMIGSLMYLTSSRPDIMFAICACVRFQVTPKVSHLHAVKGFLATIKKVNDVVQLRALIDRNKMVVTEDVIQQDLRLDDADGVECFPNEEFFTELARMGYEKPPPKLTFYKAFFSAQWKFLIHTLVQCVSAKRTTWNEFSCSMASAVICLATVIINAQVDDLTSHNTKYTSPALTQKVFANMRRVGKGFSRVETPLFASILVQPQDAKEEVEVPTAPAPPSPIITPSPPPQDPIPTPLQAQTATPYDTPLQEQSTLPHDSTIPLLTILMDTCATLSQKVAESEQDKHTQALEIINLKKRVKKVESSTYTIVGAQEDASKQRGGEIEAINADADITLVDVETQEEVADIDAELQGRINDDNAGTKDVSAAEPTVFDDEEVTMTMAQTLIKMKAKKAKLLDEQMAKRLHDEEVEKAATREKQENDDLESSSATTAEIPKSQEETNFYCSSQEEHDNLLKKYGWKKRVAEETLLQESFKKLKAVEVSSSDSTQETPTNDPKEMSKEDVQNMLEIVIVSEFKVETLQVKYPLIEWEIHSKGSRSYWKMIRVGGITEAYQSFEDMLKGFDKEDMVALWSLVKEKFSTAVPSVDKEKALWVELKRLFEPDADDVLWKL
uniref:Retrovirus-related Pol polyprotein from transposon TNT 1-94 n=1 Tax=Tanacetum cinerariifolium TaxID=118510 RepID=A0A6L2ME68_TANCI|nr:retrovirus-related Pol polyprotein from transposon TNT 1-94 [Tanacetum cinerariifolium]